jgi:formamidopyrimidine-DNA glycosylase
MPEFPEVHTIVQDLKRILKDGSIDEVKIAPDYNALPDNQKFTHQATGQEIKKVNQVAKNIIIELENGVIHCHLGMTGQILAKKTNNPLPHEQVTFKITTPSKEFYLAYRSVRKFGKVAFLSPDEYQELRDRHGISPTSEKLTPEVLQKLIKSKNTNIKNLLMEQTKIGGLGNIYATEALFMAKIHPETRTKSVDPQQTEVLLKAIKQVISEGIQNRGSTLDDEMFIDVFGKKGSQQENFRVYNQKTCPTCTSPIAKKKISGRNTYFCPVCQPEPKQQV